MVLASMRRMGTDSVHSVSTTSAMGEQRTDRLKEIRNKVKEQAMSGPDTATFFSDAANSIDGYDGKLILEKGDRRLRLPPWLKRQLPLGNDNYNKLKESLRCLR